MFRENVYTLEEVSQHLRVPAEAVQKEIAAGRLRAIDVAGYLRVCESDLNKYKGEAQARSTSTGTYTPPPDDQTCMLKPTNNFRYKWPDGKDEEFTDAQEGTASYGGRTHHVKLGFTIRHSAGKPRRRCLILVDRYATVEFVAAEQDTSPQSLMASIIKDRKGKQLPVGARVPPEYQGIRIGPYRSVVDGSGAPNGLAVLCEASDDNAMIKHALIRYKYRGERD